MIYEKQYSRFVVFVSYCKFDQKYEESLQKNKDFLEGFPAKMQWNIVVDLPTVRVSAVVYFI